MRLGLRRRQQENSAGGAGITVGTAGRSLGRAWISSRQATTCGTKGHPCIAAARLGTHCFPSSGELSGRRFEVAVSRSLKSVLRPRRRESSGTDVHGGVGKSVRVKTALAEQARTVRR